MTNLLKRLLVLAFLLVAEVLAGFAQSSLVNFAHLRHLTERIALEGDSVSIVHVYANAPTYAWVDAKESGPEGIACVDDAARAAVVYLRHYETTGDTLSLRQGRSLLEFVLKMEREDGMFYNFIAADHSINRTGTTSYPSFGWWASRGVWAMATGCRVYKDLDTAFARRLQNGVDRTIPHIDSLMLHYGRYDTLNGYRVPTWLLYGSGADVTSELLLGLVTQYGAVQSTHLRQLIEKLSEGVMTMQDGSATKYPFGLHRSWQTMWHMWGNGQTQALASGAKILRNHDMSMSAKREVTGFYSRLLIRGFMKEMDLADTTKNTTYEQIAYGVRPMAVGLIRFYELTNKPIYLKMAGLAASWLFGNNPAGQTMYDSATGRCYDGVKDSATINKNSGAESTIEALHTLVELQKYPAALPYMHYRKVRSGSTTRYEYAIFRDADNHELTFAIDLRSARSLILEEGVESSKFLTVPKMPR